MGHMGDGWGWWMAFGSVWLLAFWGLIAWAVYALVRRRPGEPGRFPRGGSTALEILRERYARGELDEERYEAMQQKLDGGTGRR